MNVQLDWQNTAALAAIAWAIWYLARRLIGVLRALGLTRRQLLTMVLVEAAVVGLAIVSVILWLKRKP